MLKKHPAVKEVLKFWAKASFIVLTIFALALFFSVLSYNLATRLEYNRTYTVTGSSERYVAPDNLTVSMATVVKDKTAKDVQRKASEIVDATVNDIKKLGLSDEEIKTSLYNIYPEYEQRNSDSNQTEQLRIIGYSANIEITIDTKKIDKASEILDKATTNGINSINSMYFSIEKLEEIKDELKLEAIYNAKEKAKKEAKKSGLRLGKVLNVYTDDDYGYYYGNQSRNVDYKMGNDSIEYSSEESSAPAISVPINPGTQAIRVDVRVEYEIK